MTFLTAYGSLNDFELSRNKQTFEVECLTLFILQVKSLMDN